MRTTALDILSPLCAGVQRILFCQGLLYTCMLPQCRDPEYNVSDRIILLEIVLSGQTANTPKVSILMPEREQFYF